jgi:iron(III) transport system permease protein
LIDLFATSSVAIPSVVAAFAYFVFYQLINRWLPLYETIWILVLAYTSRLLPEGVQGVTSSLVQVDRDLEEAARVTGSSTPRLLWSIILPLVRPGVAATAILMLILSVREIGPSLFLYNSATVVMAVQVLSSWEVGDLGGAAALSLVQSLLLTALVLFARLGLRIRLRLA